MAIRTTRHRLTRLGVQMMLIGVFGVFGGALNGLNLLIVVAALSLGVLLVQWRVSRSMIDDVLVDRRPPGEIFAGTPARFRYQIRNGGRLRPVWLLRIEDSLLLGSVRRPVWHQTVATGVGLLGANQTTSAFSDVVVARRGRYQLGKWRLSTLAPFSLSTAWRDELRSADETIDVFPKLVKLSRNWRRQLPSRMGGVSAHIQRQGPSDEVFFGLREYRRGDSPKYIHWRTTARLGVPAVRIYEQQRRYDLCLLVDPWITKSARLRPDEPLDAEAERAELAVSLAATVAVELSGGSGGMVVMVVADDQPRAISGGGSVEGLRRMLAMLAGCHPGPGGKLADALTQGVQATHHLPDLVVFSTRHQSDAVGPHSPEAESLRRWQQHGKLRWVNLASREIDQWLDAGDRLTTGVTAATQEVPA